MVSCSTYQSKRDYERVLYRKIRVMPLLLFLSLTQNFLYSKEKQTHMFDFVLYLFGLCASQAPYTRKKYENIIVRTSLQKRNFPSKKRKEHILWRGDLCTLILWPFWAFLLYIKKIHDK